MSNIIVISPAYPIRGGISHLTESLCKTYEDLGHTVEILSYYSHYIRCFNKTVNETDRHEPADFVKKLSVKHLLSPINPISWIRVAFRILKNKSDYIICVYQAPTFALCLGSISWMVKIGSKIRIIALVHEIKPDIRKNGIRYFLTKYFFRACDGVVVLSKFNLNLLRDYTDNKFIKLSSHPVYDLFGECIDKVQARKKLHLEEEGKYLLFFGYVRQNKGLDLLLKAMGDKRIKERNIRLIIAGENIDYNEMVDDLITKYNLHELITQINQYIPSNEVKYYFCAADLVIQPYRSSSQSGVTQIAYYYNKPVLVTDTGGLYEVVLNNQTGIVVKPDPDEIAEGIIRFFGKNQERGFVENITAYNKDHGWDSLVVAIEELYCDLR